MKVIKPGRKQIGWSCEAICNGNGNGGGGCGAVLLVEQPDLFKTWNGEDVCVTFTCTECGVETDLPDDCKPPTNIITHQIPSKQDWEERLVRGNNDRGIPAR